jgi:hypothetical protein
LREAIRALLVERYLDFGLTLAQEKLYEPHQIDGSPHDWFEGCGPCCTLIVFIDDATGRLVQLWFAPTGTTAVYIWVLRRHLEQYGRPVASTPIATASSASSRWSLPTAPPPPSSD